MITDSDIMTGFLALLICFFLLLFLLCWQEIRVRKLERAERYNGVLREKITRRSEFDTTDY